MCCWCMKFITYKFYRAEIVFLALVGLTVGAAGQDIVVEKPKQMPAAILRKYDSDKDGFLNEAEKAVWKADVQRGRQEAQTRRLEKYDGNRDGRLDKAEKAAAVGDALKKPRGNAKKPPANGADEAFESGTSNGTDHKSESVPK